MENELAAVESEVTGCRACRRLVDHREKVAREPPRRFAGQEYWARAIPAFGDPRARLAIIGLAPAAHGGNRTGRMFTGDESGKWLYRALFETGFASQAESTHRDDGLVLRGAFVTAAVRCAPPDNRPTVEETRRCLRYLQRELELLQPSVVVALGGIAWNAFLQVRGRSGKAALRPKPRFGHGAEVSLPEGAVLLGSYHPSQQNTFTGRLTQPMLRSVFARARALLAAGPGRPC